MVQINRQQKLAVVVILAGVLALIATTGTAQAAISGNFSSDYDANETTDVPGREIQTTGTLTVTGSSAVEPRITISSGPDTVLSGGSTQVFVEGEQAVSFDTSYQEDQVTLYTDEIRPGTQIELRFVVYPTGSGTTSVTAGEVSTNYQTPSGNAESAEFRSTARLEGAPAQRIDELQERNTELNQQLSNQPQWRLWFFILLGAIIIGTIVIAGLYYMSNNRGGPPVDDQGGDPPI